jgi:putative transposase
MGSIGDCFDNSVAEDFFATVQTELLDRSSWPTREGLAQAVSASSRASTTPVDGTPPSAISAPAVDERGHMAGRLTETVA